MYYSINMMYKLFLLFDIIMDILHNSKQLLINDIDKLFQRDQYGQSLTSMSNTQTLIFKYKYGKIFKLLTIFYPKVLANIIVEYLQRDINVKYSIIHYRSVTNDLFIGLCIIMSKIKFQLNINVTHNFINVTILNVETKIFDELIENYNKHNYYLIHDYILWFNKYMYDRCGKLHYINYSTLDCDCQHRIKYVKNGNMYTSQSICNRNNKVMRYIRNHKQLYSIICMLNIILTHIISVIKTR